MGAVAAEEPASVHGEQLQAFSSSQAITRESAPAIKGTPTAPVSPAIDEDFIVFGYHPYYRDGAEEFYRWHALTHVGYAFIGFDAAGNLDTTAWDSRPAAFLAGGDAERNGVQVHMVVANVFPFSGGFSEANLIDAMDDADGSATALINNITAELTQDLASGGNVTGVSFDLEFNWTATTRDNISAFMTDCRAAFDAWTAVDSSRPYIELSLYVNPSYSATRHDAAALNGSLDYMFYSTYPWAGGFSSSPNSIAERDRYVGELNDYLAAGFDPRKMVPILPAYSLEFYVTNPGGGEAYDWPTLDPEGSGVGDDRIRRVRTWAEAAFDARYNTVTGYPLARNYRRGDETAWTQDTGLYTPTVGAPFAVDLVTVYDDETSIEYKMRIVESNEVPSGDPALEGKRLGGVGWWELGWMSAPNSHNPRTGSSGTRRTWPQFYQIGAEVLAPEGATSYFLERFENNTLSPLWEAPLTNPDTFGMIAATLAVVGPPPAGGPTPSNSAMLVTAEFDSTPSTLPVRHAYMADDASTPDLDLGMPLGFLPNDGIIRAWINPPIAAPDVAIRILVVDGEGEIEVGPLTSLATAGWQVLSFDLLNDPVVGFTTSEPGLSNGDGVLDLTGNAPREIAFYGFIILTITATGTFDLWIDDITYSRAGASGGEYTINEVRYDLVGVAEDGEFVEVYGPAGPLPSNLVLRSYNPGTGAILNEVPLAGSIPNDTGTGFGYFVVGDPSVPNVDDSSAFGATVDDLSGTDPSALQLLDAVTGEVYDSIVYEAWGGLDELVRVETLGVANEGAAWIGQVAPGAYSIGRYPDGTDTNNNASDFAVQPLSPGATNGDTVGALPVSFNFDSFPPNAFLTFDYALAGSVASGVGPSADGGNVLRVADVSGGNILFLGDASLGITGGHSVAGELYIPTAAGDAEAIAVGFCGTQGSTFFEDTPQNSGYENGYWLIYHNNGGVDINNGLGNHAQEFKLVHASNDNLDAQIVEELGTLTLAGSGASEGAWTTFALSIDPFAGPSGELIARINDQDVYVGPIPEGGRTSGAVQIGHREDASGTTATMGTWVDALVIDAPLATSVTDFMLLDEY